MHCFRKGKYYVNIDAETPQKHFEENCQRHFENKLRLRLYQVCFIFQNINNVTLKTVRTIVMLHCF